MPEWSVETENLTRRFGGFGAVDGISIRVRQWQIDGFLGPNGAGNSTTIRMLTGIFAPTNGSGRVAGFDIARERRRIKSAIGSMSQRFSLYEDLTVRENLELCTTSSRHFDGQRHPRVISLEP
jgi:ABC-2 type transport system ATP-binding protein